ncbi:putative integral membrane protein [Streptomyces avermitilis MA-4680 = NBRC 14893]|uniref:Integral membrane protein n=2 Tax=Streptomyces TaxID=1883 RepID=Q82RP4_STRAW|nr:putative integral membrane protein [Streptomyces avermitilis MA-4680 = NBRC 14893]
MFCWIGEAATRRPRLVLFGAFVFLVLCVALGAGAGGRLKTQGYDDPRSDSSFAARVTAEHLGAAPNLVVVVQVPGGFVDDAAAQRAGEDLTRRLAAQPQVSAVSSYWRGRAAELRSRDGRSAMLLAHVDGTGEELGGRVKRLREALTAAGPYTGGSSAPGPSTAGPSTPGPSAAGPSAAGSSTGGSPAGGSSARAAAKGMPALKVHVGGPALVDAELQDLSESDLKRAEAVVLPGTLILLVLVFGSVVAALLPLLIGVLSIAGTLLVLSVLGRVTDVSVFALNLTTVLGLGLGIDYGLLIVSRFREEITGGHSARDAALRTVRTEGHTIVFSAATVCAALATLLVFPPYFLRSFAYAGIAVVAIAAVAALTIMPALLTLLGKRVNAWPVPWRRRVQAGCASRWWEALARRVVRRPVLAAVPVIGLLAVLAAPFAHAGFATPDDRALPAGSFSRQAGDLVRGEFGTRSAGALTVFTTSATPQVALDYAPRLSALPGVAQVVGPFGVYRDGRQVAASGPGQAGPSGTDRAAFHSVVPSADPRSGAAQRLVRAIRAMPTPADTHVHVGGPSAVLVDAKDTVAGRLPLALAVITLTTSVLLFGFTRSVILPLKAIALNALSLAAVMGAMVWVFQTGHLQSLLGFTPGPLSTTMPVLLFCIVFGLSVDYEVFVLARIKEAHDAGQDTAGSIVTGIARTGGIVTTAGALLAFTLLSFGTSQVSLLQFFGIGAGLGVLLDATLVRGVLVPALMRLAGGWNWWAPRGLRRDRPARNGPPVTGDPPARRAPPPPPARHAPPTPPVPPVPQVSQASQASQAPAGAGPAVPPVSSPSRRTPDVSRSSHPTQEGLS